MSRSPKILTLPSKAGKARPKPQLVPNSVRANAPTLVAKQKIHLDRCNRESAPI
jgi:hypothetical protein